MAEIDQAMALFRSFHQRDPVGDELATLAYGRERVTALEVGPAISIGYKALGEKFYHEFGGTLPRLYVRADGRQIFFVGGIYRFTDRGFIK